MWFQGMTISGVTIRRSVECRVIVLTMLACALELAATNFPCVKLSRDLVQIMGHMDVIGFISDGFNIYFPIAIVLLCALTLCNIGTRVLNALGIQQFMVDDDITQELVDEGKEIVRRGLDSIILSF